MNDENPNWGSWYFAYIFTFFFQMSKPRKFMNIDSAVEFLKAIEDEIPTNCQHETVDIIELPPETVDEMSNAEEFENR